MRPFLLTCAFLLISSTCWAAELAVPEQKIVGADKPIPYGELVILSVTPPGKVENLASTSYTWKVFQGTAEKRFAVDAEGRVFFGSGTGKEGTSSSYLAVLAITHVFLVQEEGKTKQVVAKTSILSTQVVVGDPAQPRPPPTPAPAPEQEPSFTGEKLGLAKFAWKTATQTVTGTGRQSQSRALADAYRKTAAAIKDENLKDPRVILQRAKQNNDAALGTQTEPWEAFSEKLADELFRLYEADKLKTPQDFLQAWAEIEAGLREVK